LKGFEIMPGLDVAALTIVYRFKALHACMIDAHCREVLWLRLDMDGQLPHEQQCPLFKNAFMRASPY
jgi:hypothetical protein